jgi:hypothetical protein
MPTILAVILGTAFGMVLIDTIEALILGDAHIGVIAGCMTFMLLLASVIYIGWKKSD